MAKILWYVTTNQEEEEPWMKQPRRWRSISSGQKLTWETINKYLNLIPRDTTEQFLFSEHVTTATLLVLEVALDFSSTEVFMSYLHLFSAYCSRFQWYHPLENIPRRYGTDLSVGKKKGGRVGPIWMAWSREAHLVFQMLNTLSVAAAAALHPHGWARLPSLAMNMATALPP